MNTITQQGVDVSVTVNGKPVRTFLKGGRYYIESREGTEYAIEIKNNNSFRIEAVAAVDGLNVITGKRASTTDIGYIINAWSKVTIKGFRKDTEEVGAFKFVRKEKSYAEVKGQGDNVGIIAVAVYREKVAPQPITIIKEKHIHHDHYYPKPYYPPYDPWKWNQPIWWGGEPYCGAFGAGGGTFGAGGSDFGAGGGTIGGGNTTANVNFCSVVNSNAGAGGAGGSNFGENITFTKAAQKIMNACSLQTKTAEDVSFDFGTTWGTKLQDKVNTVVWERDYLITTFEILYNSKENLEALGIKFVQEKLISKPKGFPADFAEPPPGWDN